MVNVGLRSRHRELGINGRLPAAGINNAWSLAATILLCTKLQVPVSAHSAIQARLPQLDYAPPRYAHGTQHGAYCYSNMSKCITMRRVAPSCSRAACERLCCAR